MEQLTKMLKDRCSHGSLTVMALLPSVIVGVATRTQPYHRWTLIVCMTSADSSDVSENSHT